jgi:hypothetical protein
MPTGLRHPPGKLGGDKGGYKGPKRYPFWMKTLTDKEVDPRDWPPIPGTPMEKYENGIDPQKTLEELPLDQLLRLWTHRRSIAYSRGKHELFEILMHLIFPKPIERTLVYVAVWRHRDRCSLRQIGKRLGTRQKMEVNTRIVKKYLNYIDKQISAFVGKYALKKKFAQDLMRDAKLEEDKQLEEDVREVFFG